MSWTNRQLNVSLAKARHPGVLKALFRFVSPQVTQQYSDMLNGECIYTAVVACNALLLRLDATAAPHHFGRDPFDHGAPLLAAFMPPSKKLKSIWPHSIVIYIAKCMLRDNQSGKNLTFFACTKCVVILIQPPCLRWIPNKSKWLIHRLTRIRI